MGLVDSFSGLFRQKSSAKQVSIEEAKAIVSEEIGKHEKELLDFAPKKFAEIKHLISSLSKNADFLESQEINIDEGNRRFRQVVVTSQKNLARQLKGLSQKIMPPSIPTIASVREYSGRALRSVSFDLLPYWKTIAIAKTLLSESLGKIGEDIGELSRVLEELGKKANGEQALLLRSLESLMAEEKESRERLLKISGEIGQARKAVSSMEEKVSILEKSFGEKLASQENLVLKKLEEQKKGLESRKQGIVSSFNSEIAPLEKVFKRLSSLAKESGPLAQKEAEVLSMLLSMPASAFITDPNGTTTKSIFTKAGKMIGDGSIALKEKEREKRLNAISSFLGKDFFSEYFWPVNKLQAEILQLERRASSMKIGSEINSARLAVDSARTELSAQGQELERLLKQKALAEASSWEKRFRALFSRYFGERFEFGNPK